MIRAIKRWLKRRQPNPMGEHVAGQRAVAVHVVESGRLTRGVKGWLRR